ncbi:MAG: 4-hydroxy-tetrahydrodipicolinate reductase [Planctomycetota bacterium]|jgi:4-hydroxy-tetrahydrodipicolinate reductase
MVVRLAVSGALGRMGTMVWSEATADARFEIVQLLEIEERGDAVGTPLPVETRLADGADVLVDFSTPAGFKERLLECVQRKVAFVSGTTGLSAAEVDLLVDASSVIPVLHAPNMSLGVEVLSRAVSLIASLLPAGFDAEVTETHHRGKRDAPSGTALRILEILRAAPGREAGETVHGRQGRSAARLDGEIGVHAVRGGDVIGEHTVHFLGPAERMEITHRCTDRAVFARGALHCAHCVASGKPGRYRIADLLSTGSAGAPEGGQDSENSI